MFLYMPEMALSIPCNEFGLDIFMPNFCVTTILSGLYTVNRIENIAKRLNIAKSLLFGQWFSNFECQEPPKYDDALAREPVLNI